MKSNMVLHQLIRLFGPWDFLLSQHLEVHSSLYLLFIKQINLWGSGNSLVGVVRIFLVLLDLRWEKPPSLVFGMTYGKVRAAPLGSVSRVIYHCLP
jgi:hypothetical protein